MCPSLSSQILPSHWTLTLPLYCLIIIIILANPTWWFFILTTSSNFFSHPSFMNFPSLYPLVLSSSSSFSHHYASLFLMLLFCSHRLSSCHYLFSTSPQIYFSWISLPYMCLVSSVILLTPSFSLPSHIHWESIVVSWWRHNTTSTNLTSPSYRDTLVRVSVGRNLHHVCLRSGQNSCWLPVNSN